MAVDCVSAAMLLESFEVQLKVTDDQFEQAKEQLRKERIQLRTETSSLNQRIVEIEEIAYQLNEIIKQLGYSIREKEKENQVLRNSEAMDCKVRSQHNTGRSGCC